MEKYRNYKVARAIDKQSLSRYNNEDKKRYSRGQRALDYILLRVRLPVESLSQPCSSRL